MSDRIAVMNEGRLEQIAGPEEIYERPATTFVAGFIGVSNLMPGTIDSGGEVRLDTGPTVRTAEVNGFKTGDRCFAVVRPEKLWIDSAAQPADPRLPCVEGTVESSLYLGTSTQVVVDLGDEVRMTVLHPNVNDAERQRLPGGGAQVRLSWQPEHMHLVRASTDAQRGEALKDRTEGVEQ
jgi:spermidine/putrescine transport system ATP-binding protein